MNRLADALARERLLLEQAVFKLSQMRQMLLAGDARFLAWAAEELEQSLDALAACEVERSMIVLRLADELGRPGDELTLPELIGAAPAPWNTIMADHRSGMIELQGEMRSLTGENRRLAEAGTRVVTDALERAYGLEPAMPGARNIAREWQPDAPTIRVEQKL